MKRKVFFKVVLVFCDPQGLKFIVQIVSWFLRHRSDSHLYILGGFFFVCVGHTDRNGFRTVPVVIFSGKGELKTFGIEDFGPCNPTFLQFLNVILR